MTATALSSLATWRTPGTASAAASSNEASVPPNTGDAATVATFMPGTFTSMPYIAVPLTLPATSRRLAGVPMMRNLLGSLSLTSVGTGSFAASSTRAP